MRLALPWLQAEGGRRLQAAKRGAAVPAKRAQRGQAIVEDELGELGANPILR